jgi:hypothetical protein
MVVIRGTRKLLMRLPYEVVATPPKSTTVLGDWYVDLLFTKPQVVLCVSQHARLPVVMPARELRTVGDRLPRTLGKLLAAVGIGAAAIAQEVEAMALVVFAKTANRSLLGTMNDFTVAMKRALSDDPAMDLDALSLDLADTPVGPMAYEHPAGVVQRLLGGVGGS